MDFSAKIREIQHSQSFDKIRDVKELFNNLYQFSSFFLQAAQKAVCDNIESSANIVPIDLSGLDFDQAQQLANSLNFGLVQGGSGTTYLSWSKKLFSDKDEKHEDDHDFFAKISERLHDSGRKGLLSEEFEILKKSYPERDFKLVFGTFSQAQKNGIDLQKKAYCIFEDAIYLLSN